MPELNAADHARIAVIGAAMKAVAELHADDETANAADDAIDARARDLVAALDGDKLADLRADVRAFLRMFDAELLDRRIERSIATQAALDVLRIQAKGGS